MVNIRFIALSARLTVTSTIHYRDCLLAYRDCLPARNHFHRGLTLEATWRLGAPAGVAPERVNTTVCAPQFPITSLSCLEEFEHPVDARLPERPNPHRNGTDSYRRGSESERLEHVRSRRTPLSKNTEFDL